MRCNRTLENQFCFWKLYVHSHYLKYFLLPFKCVSLQACDTCNLAPRFITVWLIANNRKSKTSILRRMPTDYSGSCLISLKVCVTEIFWLCEVLLEENKRCGRKCPKTSGNSEQVSSCSFIKRTHTHTHTRPASPLLHYVCANVTLIMLVVNWLCLASSRCQSKRLLGRARLSLKAAFRVCGV